VAETRDLEIALRKHPRIFANIAEVDGAILQAALGGADFLLLPGPVEPGGELLMLALRNGVLPIAAHCGGLRQFVRDYDPVTGDGNGFVFYRQTTGALCDAIRRAVTIEDAEQESLVRAARAADFSWPAAARRHESLFKRLMAQAGRPVAA
jgi:starch synthase